MEKEKQKTDQIFKGIVFLLLVFGLVMIASAGVMLSKTKFGDEYYFFKHQLINGVIPGLIALSIVQRINYNFWRKVAVPFFFVSLIFLGLVFIPSIGGRFQGASRWIDLGFISFQPSEMMKLALILYLAVWIESRGKKIRDFFEGTIPFLAILGLVGILIILQPDVGTLGVIAFSSLAMFFVSGVPLKYLGAIFLSGILLVAILVKVEPYRMNRLTTFLNPEHDPLGIGYQVKQAKIAVGSGGIFGLGLGKSRQKFNYLPEPVGDSIYAITAEELGMIGATGVALGFLLLALRGFRIASKAPDVFSQMVVVGIVSWIAFQAFVNMGAIISLMPLTGIPMPFVSYGSTSLIFSLVGAGIVLSVSRQSKI